MLAVLRKYQKFLIAIVSVFLVFSFLFFGLFGALQRMPKQAQDKVIGKAIDGSDVSLITSEGLVRLISSDYLDNHLIQRRQMPNLFNDGVIRKDFIQTGLGALIAEHYFDEISADLKKRHEQALKFKPYEHPQAKFLSMQTVWSQFAPELSGRVKCVQEMEFGPGVFDALARTYVDQGGLNAEAMRRMLYSQQSQFQWMQPDPFLTHGDLGLFGAHSLEDWFGRRFLEIAAQVIHNSSILAEQNGYKVGYQEAKVDLMQNGYEYLCASRRGEKIGATDVAEMFEKQLMHLHMSEKEAVESWREVMLFRRLFDEIGGSVYPDPLLQKQYDLFANAGRKVTTYRLSETVRREPYLATLYAELVGKPSEGFPLEAKSVTDVPGELKEERFFADVVAVDKMSLTEKVSVKEMLKFELDAENFNQLKGKFPDLKKAESREGRLASLDALPSGVRDQLDSYVREQVIDQHPEWIQEVLDHTQAEEQVLHVALAGDREPLTGITHLEAFSKLLKEKSEKLNAFTDDGKHFYKIVVKKFGAGPEILTFQEALEAKALEKLMNRKLEKGYASIRAKSPEAYQDDKGEWKPWYDVKTELARTTYEKAFDKRAKAYMSEMQKQLIADKAQTLVGFAEQWNVVKSDEQVVRSEPHWFLEEALCKKEIGTWINVTKSKQGDYLFGYIEGDATAKTPTAISVRASQELLSREAKRAMLQNLLDKVTLAPHV